MAQSEFLGIDIGTSTIEIARFIHSQNRVEMVKFDDGNYYYPMYYARGKVSVKETFGSKAKEYNICIARSLKVGIAMFLSFNLYLSRIIIFLNG